MFNTLDYTMSDDSIISAVFNGNIQLFNDLSLVTVLNDNVKNDLCRIAAEHNQLDMLMHLHKQGYLLNVDTFNEAAFCGNINMVQYLYNNHCPWDEKTCSCSVFGSMFQKTDADHIKCLRFLHEHGCPWDEDTIDKAISLNSMTILKYACEHGCNQTNGVTIAAKIGKLECLRYLHEIQGNELLSSDIVIASKFNRIDCVKYMHEHGCPLTKSAYDIAIEHYAINCIEYIQEHECDIH